MGTKSSSIVAVLACFLLFSSTANAFNITRLLDRFPNYSNFNSYLTETGLAKQINSRQTITVLAVQNDDLGDLSGKPTDVIKSILSVHVILDYYDVPKLQHLSKKSSIVTTMFQASGIAASQQGFLNITDLPNNEVGFKSAIKGTSLDVKLVNLVAAQPYNVSVLQVSGVIVTPGIDGNFTAPPKKSPTPAPAPSQSKKSPSPSPTPTPTPTPSPSPADDEVADSPTESPAESPEEAPVSSPPVSADAPAADEKEADAPAPSKSSAMKFAASGLFSGLVVALVSAL